MMPATKDSALREEICTLGRSLFDRGLTAGSSGNISAALDDGGWLATPTNVSLGRLDPAGLTRLDAVGKPISGDAPTKELPLHRAVYRARAGTGAIVHLHSHYSVTASMLADVDPTCVFPPLTPYSVMRVGRVPLIPYFRPGDPALARSIEAQAARHRVVLLANHGPVVAGRSLEDAAGAIEELEATARLFIALRGISHRTLNEAQVEELRDMFGADW